MVQYALVLGIAASALVLPSSALAAETAINFDDQPAHTTISNQYSAQGVTFDEGPSGPAGLQPFTEAPPAGQAHSPPNVLNISKGCGGEFPHAELWGRFSVPRNYVNLFVGNVYPELIAETQEVKLQGFDLGGNPIPGASDTVSMKGLGVDTEASISDAESEISYFQITSNQNTFCGVAIDDLSFEAVPSTIPPDFGLSAPSIGPTLTPGSSAEVTLKLRRNSTSTGPISFSVSGEPIGVHGSVNPMTSSGPDGSSLTLTLSAASNAQPFSEVPVTIIGTPSSTAGGHQRSVTILVSVIGNFDLRAQGLEVTQGIQREGPLTPSGGESGGSYSGVSLVAHKQTAVRFYADAHGGIGSGITNVGVWLSASRDGRELPGGPLYPDYGPAKLQGTEEPDPAPVLEPERKSEANAYTFTLPQSWTESGSIQLVGHVFQEPSFPGPEQRPECSSPACQSNNSFTINEVTFHDTKTVELDTLALSTNGELPVSADVALEDAKLVTPMANPGWNPRNPNDGFTVLPYQGIIDISDIVNSSSNETDKGGAAHGRVRDWASAMGFPNFSTMGIGKGGFRGVTGGGLESAFGTYGNISAITFNPANPPGNRPLTGVAHELFHQFGLAHASSECGGGDDGDGDDEGQSGTPWPLKPGETHASEAAALGEPGPFANHGGDNPNSTEGFGQLLGIGLRMDSYPYRIVADGVNWGQKMGGQDMDLMSYCAGKTGGMGSGDPGAWVSPINWEALYRTFAASAFASSSRSADQAALSSSNESEARGDRAGPSSQASAARRGAGRGDVRITRGRLRVVGYYSGSSFSFTSVGPQVGPPLKAGTSSFTLLARGRGGQILRSVTMAAQHIHEDGVAVLLELSGEIPSHGVQSVEVLDNGVAVASRKRPPHPPRVRILAPHPGARVGGRRKVVVSWRATSPDHQSLTASVDYSANSGRSWKTVFIGPNTGHASLPGSYLEGSPSARVRVRVNDGFNESVAVSSPFTVLDAPPEVNIAKTPVSIPGDARLQLQGQAFDQLPSALGGRSLHWFDGPFALGSGAAISAGPLPPGKNHIRLVARDAGGAATARVPVNVSQVKLPYLQLAIPKSFPGSARKLVLHARSAVAATLTVGKRRFSLDSKRKKLSLPIKGARSLLLHLTVTAGGVETPFSALVRRR